MNRQQNKSQLRPNKSSLTKRPQSISSEYSLESCNTHSSILSTIVYPSNHSLSVHNSNSDNISSNSTLSGQSSGGSASILTSSNTSQLSLKMDKLSPLQNHSNSMGSTESSQSSIYLNKQGKVEKHILDQIAGVNEGRLFCF